MKEGYIVWNNSNYGIVIYGVYKTWEKALRQFRKVIKNEFGKCPRDYDTILDFLADNQDMDDSYGIEYFEENIG